MEKLTDATPITVESAGDADILDAVTRAVNQYGFCPNRVWGVASSHPEKETHLAVSFSVERPRVDRTVWSKG